MKIAVVGGGPAGLFFARLAKRHDPSAQIDVFEQNPANATFGFGVGLDQSARKRLSDYDAEVIDALEARMSFGDAQRIGLDSEIVDLKYAAQSGAIERLQLLEVLETKCRETGIEVIHNRRIETLEDLEGYDLVVGADGANSLIRQFGAADFQPRERLLDNRFAWYGFDKPLKPSGLIFRRHEGGCYIAHYYAYTPTKSTFVAECDGQTWTDCGLDRMTDSERKVLIEEIFADVLGGAPLLENKSVWRQFNAITATNWVSGNMVLIGDALRVAHFSIGSGTRIAMDDALDLFIAFQDHGDDVAALTQAYEARRRHNRDLFTSATVRSFEWYDEVRAHMDQPILDFVYDFMTRTGRIDDERLRGYAPDFYKNYLAHKAGKTASVG